MPRDRFVEPATTRIELSDDDWIIVKDAISEGERLRIEGTTLRTRPGADGETEVGIDWARFRIQRVVTWVTEWSFRRYGKPVTVSRDAVAALDTETAAEIHEALDRHIDAMAEAKKATRGETGPAASP